MAREITEEYTYRLLGCAYTVHKELGPGLLETIYEKALELELKANGFEVAHQVSVPVRYKGMSICDNLKLDLLIDNQVILELKSVEEVAPVAFKQLMTYLRLTGCRLGYLINFNVDYLKHGIHRVVNNF